MNKLYLLVAIIAMAGIANAQSAEPCDPGSAGGQAACVIAPNGTRCGEGGFCLTTQDDPLNCGSWGKHCKDVHNYGDATCSAGSCTCEECGDQGDIEIVQPGQTAPTLEPPRLQ